MLNLICGGKVYIFQYKQARRKVHSIRDYIMSKSQIKGKEIDISLAHTVIALVPSSRPAFGDLAWCAIIDP